MHSPATEIFHPLSSDELLRLLPWPAPYLHGSDDPIQLGANKNESLTVGLINALYADEFDCTLCRNLLAQTEKQLKLILVFLPDFESTMKSCTQHIKQRHNKKQICNSIISTTHRE
jgi:hypothetical protein